MKRISTLVLPLLVGLLLLPLFLLLSSSLRLFLPVSPCAIPGADGTRSLGVFLERDRRELETGTVRVLGADGTVRVLAQPAGPRETDDSAWVVVRDDGPILLGRLVAVVPGDSDSLRGAAAVEALERMPRRIRVDRNRLAREVRGSRGGTGFAAAMRRWDLQEAWDRRMVAVFADLDGTRRVARLSSIREARLPPRTVVRAWLAVPGRILSSLGGSPDSWTGGGLLPVVQGTLALVLLAGFVGGFPALLAAIRIADRTEPDASARWVRRVAAWFSAVPGVVWGAIGAGLLAGGLGSALDSTFGVSGWGSGGILWGAITLGALSAPTTLSHALTSLDRIPGSWRTIARSSGATRWQVLRWVVLPQAWRGLAGAWFAGLARAAGETAPLLMLGAARSLGGRTFESSHGWQMLSGGFLHLGVLACDPPWPVLEAEMGHPLAFLSLSVLALLCIVLEFAGLALSRRTGVVPG